LKITEVDKMFGLHFPRLKLFIDFDKNFGQIFTNASGRSAEEQQRGRGRLGLNFMKLDFGQKVF
jgi:hypothetical protein